MFTDQKFVLLETDFVECLVERVRHDSCDNYNCQRCPYGTKHNGFNTFCSELSAEQLLSIMKKLHKG